MRRMEVLLSFRNEKDMGSKVAFHLRALGAPRGWDNPNVFQICTLNRR
jgi:restriction endonuclease